MQHALTFGAHEVKTITREGQRWISNRQLTELLGYADEKSVHRLYTAHGDEFTHTMARVFRVATAGGKQAMRFFSLRGAHLVAMFARTPVAKAFRVWVLNILDQEIEQDRVERAGSVTLSEVQKRELDSLCVEVNFMSAWWEKFGPAVELLNPTLFSASFEIFNMARSRARWIAKDLGFQTWNKYFDTYPWHKGYTDKMLHRERAIREGWK
jgi:prophage antirepressor-like protein